MINIPSNPDHSMILDSMKTASVCNHASYPSAVLKDLPKYRIQTLGQLTILYQEGLVTITEGTILRFLQYSFSWYHSFSKSKLDKNIIFFSCKERHGKSTLEMEIKKRQCEKNQTQIERLKAPDHRNLNIYYSIWLCKVKAASRQFFKKHKPKLQAKRPEQFSNLTPLSRTLALWGSITLKVPLSITGQNHTDCKSGFPLLNRGLACCFFFHQN